MNDTASAIQQWVDIIEPVQPVTEISPLLYVFLGVLFMTCIVIAYLYLNDDRRKLKRKIHKIRRHLALGVCQPAEAARSVYSALTNYFDSPVLNNSSLPNSFIKNNWSEFCIEINRMCFSDNDLSDTDAIHLIDRALAYIK